MNLVLLTCATVTGFFAMFGFMAGIRREEYEKPNLTQWYISGLVGLWVAAMVLSLFRT